jgi:hypothetical protein
VLKDFLKTLYKLSATDHIDNGIDYLFRVVPHLKSERRFAELNDLLISLDLTRLDTSLIYAMVNITSDYREQLPYWTGFYQACREEFARRGEPQNRIGDLFDRYKEQDPKRKFDPDAKVTPYKSIELVTDERIKARIDLANSQGDKELADLLTYYQAERLNREERQRKFQQLRATAGDEELRKRCVKSLREIADTLDKTESCWPGIYYCDLPDDPLLKKTFIDGIEVIISYPWPG